MLLPHYTDRLHLLLESITTDSPAFLPLLVARPTEPNLPQTMAAAQGTRARSFPFPSPGNLCCTQASPLIHAVGILALTVLSVFPIGVFAGHLPAIHPWEGV